MESLPISYRMTQDDKGIGVLLDLRAAWGWDCHIWSVTFLAESNQSEPPTAETSFMQNDGQMSSTANPCFLALQSCSASASPPAYLRKTGICRMRAHAYKISLAPCLHEGYWNAIFHLRITSTSDHPASLPKLLAQPWHTACFGFPNTTGEQVPRAFSSWRFLTLLTWRRTSSYWMFLCLALLVASCSIESKGQQDDTSIHQLFRLLSAGFRLAGLIRGMLLTAKQSTLTLEVFTDLPFSEWKLCSRFAQPLFRKLSIKTWGESIASPQRWRIQPRVTILISQFIQALSHLHWFPGVCTCHLRKQWEAHYSDDRTFSANISVLSACCSSCKLRLCYISANGLANKARKCGINSSSWDRFWETLFEQDGKPAHQLQDDSGWQRYWCFVGPSSCMRLGLSHMVGHFLGGIESIRTPNCANLIHAKRWTKPKMWLSFSQDRLIGLKPAMHAGQKRLTMSRTSLTAP